MVAPTAASTQTWAICTRASAAHVEAIRQFVSEQCYRVQFAMLEAEPRADTIVCQVCLGDTKEAVAMQAGVQACHGTSCHMLLFRRAALHTKL